MPFTERQKELILKAVDIVSDGGVTALTLKNLAASAGITEGAIYRHFEDKHHILLSILEYFMESQRSNISSMLEAKGPPLRILQRLISGKLEALARNTSLSVSLFQCFFLAGDTALQSKAREIVSHHRDFITALIARGQQEGGIRSDIPAGHLCLHIIGSMRFLVLQWIISGFEFNLETRGAELWSSTEILVSSPEIERS